jgi:hypothetical protein
MICTAKLSSVAFEFMLFVILAANFSAACILRDGWKRKRRGKEERRKGEERRRGKEKGRKEERSGKEWKGVVRSGKGWKGVERSGRKHKGA